MAAGGELAALFAQRAKVADINNGGDSKGPDDAAQEERREDNVTTEEVEPPPSEPASPGVTASSPRLPPRAAPSPTSTTATPAEEPVKVTSLLSNEDMKAKFDSRNLEAGIPTPSFLADVRKNLKKPGEQKTTVVAGGGVDGGDGVSCSSENKKKQVDKTYIKSNSDDNEGGKKKKNSQQLRSAASACSASSAPVDELAAGAASAIATKLMNQKMHKRSNSDMSSGSQLQKGALAARRSRMVASRALRASASSDKSEGSDVQKKTSPSANLRRKKLLATVRASQISTCNKTGDATNTADVSADFDVYKTAVVSPKSDEFEVLFADDDFNFDEMHTESSIPNNSASSAATLPISNSCIQPRLGGKDANITPTKPRNPQQSRLHNASTPKIRGSSRRGNYDVTAPAFPAMHQAGESGPSGDVVSGAVRISFLSSKPLQSSPKRSQKQLSPIQSFQDQEEDMDEEMQPEDFVPLDLESTPRRSSERGPSPSQMSQMSGITTPSCFPQEFHAPPTYPSLGHLHQPMLVGGPINESTSTSSSPLMGSGGPQQIIGTSSGAFSSGREAENRRLREQLGSMERKLEEREAIISQLMKRIGDLERSQAKAHHVNASSFNTDSQSHQSHNIMATPSSVSSSLLSQGQQSEALGLSAFLRQNNSFDSESALPPSPRQQQQQQQKSSRSRGSGKATKKSPNTVLTSSTASVTTTNSSKSKNSGRSRRKQTASRSVDKTKGQSPRSRSSQNMDEERKFVC